MRFFKFDIENNLIIFPNNNHLLQGWRFVDVLIHLDIRNVH